MIVLQAQAGLQTFLEHNPHLEKLPFVRYNMRVKSSLGVGVKSLEASIAAAIAAAITGALTLVQVAPIKINPWSWLAHKIGRLFNGDVLDELASIKDAQRATRAALDEHIRADDARAADGHRERILRFNNELIRSIPHTREDFIEILAEIDKYEKYCKSHPEYENNRATHAIANIGRVYDDRLKNHDFV